MGVINPRIRQKRPLRGVIKRLNGEEGSVRYEKEKALLMGIVHDVAQLKEKGL